MTQSCKTIVVLLLILFVFWGCSKVNRDNFDKIKMGMDYQEVIEIIGEPDRCDAVLGTKSCVWGSESKNISIQFVADKVALPKMKGL